MNQYFRHYEFDEMVNSLQLEIVKALREPDMIELTASTLTTALTQYMMYLDASDRDEIPKNWRHDWQLIGESTPEI